MNKRMIKNRNVRSNHMKSYENPLPQMKTSIFLLAALAAALSCSAAQALPIPSDNGGGAFAAPPFRRSPVYCS